MSIGNKGLNRERLRDNILAAIGDQTYREVAEAIDCNPILVGQWARGEKSPGLEMVVKLSRYTGVSMDDLTEGVLSASAEKNIKKVHPKGKEPLSNACVMAVWKWLLNYQVRAAGLYGKYSPYEVLSWVANDWRREHETD